MGRIAIQAFIIVCFIAGVSQPVLAGDGFKYISLNEGLSNAYVHAIVQDEYGYIWIGADDGLNKFNGYEMTVYRNDPSDSLSVSGNSISSLLYDSRGRLWIGSEEGLDLYLPDKDCFKRVRNSAPNISALFESSDSTIWIGYAQGIATYNEKENKFEKAVFEDGSTGKIFDDADYPVNVFKEYDEQRLIVGTWQGVLIIDRKRRQINVVSGNGKDLEIEHVSSLETDGNKNIWIGDYGNGVFHFDLARNSLKKIDISGKNSIDNRILSVFDDGQGHIWIGTEQSGLFKLYINSYDSEGFEYEHFIDDELPGSLSYRSVTCMFKDREDGLWIGTHNGGVNYLGAENPYFNVIRRNPFVENTLSHKKVWGLCEDKNGNLWIGTDGGGLDYFNKKNGLFKKFKADGRPGSLSDNAILSAYRDKQGDLWFGSYAGGLNRYLPETQTFEVFEFDAHDSTSLGGNDVRAIIQDENNVVWIGTNQGGLNALDKKTGKFKRYHTANSSLATNDIRALYIDRRQRLWIGTYGQGIYLKHKGRFINFRLPDAAANDNIFFAIDEDSSGNLWLGSYGAGLVKFDPVSKRFEIFNEKKGLANNVVHALTVYGNQVWLSTNQGISRFDIDKQEFSNYNTADGLSTLAFNDGSVLHAQSGQLYFGSLDGLVYFNPDEQYLQQNPPRAIIEELKIFDKTIKSGNSRENAFLTKEINSADRIELTSSQTLFSLKYAAIYFPNPEKLYYSYKLDGIDEQWHYVEKLRNVTYTALPGGDYVFKVRSSLDNKNWSEETALPITILPPWWKTSWAYGFYSLIAALFIFATRRYRKNKIKMERKIELEQLEKKRLAEIYNLKMNFFTNISHEFRTPLTLIITPLEQIIRNQNLHDITKKKLLSIYNHAHKLLHLINQLMDFRKVETGNMNLKVTENDLVSFSYEVYHAFSELAALNNIDFTFKSNVENLKLWFNQKHFETILYNLISNAFKYTPNQGKISIVIEARHEEGICYILIKDNGKGISGEYINQIFNRYYQLVEAETINIMGTGIGLALVKDLVELHKGIIEVKSEKDKGTEMVLRFQLGSEHFMENQLMKERADGERLETYSANGISHDVKPEDNAVNHKHAVLIVEDNEDIRGYLKSLLADSYKIYEAEDGSEAFQLAKSKDPSLVISDIMMPRVDGIELCRRLKSDSHTLHIPVILLTAKADDLHKLEGISIGADDYITKPFNAEILIAKIGNIIRNQVRLQDYFLSRIMLQPIDNEAPSADKEFLDKAIELVEQNLLTPDFGIKNLMDELCVSQPTLYRRIKQLTGESTTEFIRSVRVKRAAELIGQNKYSITQIAYDVGFSSVRYFRDSFYRIYKKTPSEYARQCKSLEEKTYK